MLKRLGFVTNSSSTSYLVFGVWLSREQMEPIHNALLLACEDEIIKEAKKWETDIGSPEEYGSTEAYLQELLAELGDYDVFLSNTLPPPLSILIDKYDADGYIYINKSLDIGVQDGQVSFDHIEPTDVGVLKAFLEEYKIPDANPQLHKWTRQY